MQLMFRANFNNNQHILMDRFHPGETQGSHDLFMTDRMFLCSALF